MAGGLAGLMYRSAVKLRFFVAAVLTLAVSACTPAATAAANHAQQQWPAGWTLPSHQLSPGATQPGYGIRDICPHVNPGLEAMRPSAAAKARVYAAYGIKSHRAGQYEIDHIIPVELDGLVPAPAKWPTENLYPELNDKPDPAMIRKYHLNPKFTENSKDVLEDVLHADVCSGKVPLGVAQKAIAADWRVAYVKYVGRAP